MIGFLVPVVFLAVLMALTLGLSFLCVEAVLRSMQRGLALEQARAMPRTQDERRVASRRQIAA